MTRFPKLRKVLDSGNVSVSTASPLCRSSPRCDHYDLGESQESTRTIGRIRSRSSLGSFLYRSLLRQGGQQTQSLSQQEYVSRINEMSKDMSQAWKNDQRVKTLKLVIQVERLSIRRAHHSNVSFVELQIARGHERVGVLSEQVLSHHRCPRHVR